MSPGTPATAEIRPALSGPMYWNRSGATLVEFGGASRCANAPIVNDKAQMMPTQSLENMKPPRMGTGRIPCLVVAAVLEAVPGTGAHWVLLGPEAELRRTPWSLLEAAEIIRGTDYPRLTSPR